MKQPISQTFIILFFSRMTKKVVKSCYTLLLLSKILMYKEQCLKITLKSLLLQECEQSLFQDTYVRILFTFFIVQNSFYFDDFFADLIFKHCGYAQ